MVVEQGTRTDIGENLTLANAKEPDREEKRKQCIASGGTWDEKTQSCILYKPEKTTEELAKEERGKQVINTKTGELGTIGEQERSTAPLVPETFSSIESGRASGIALPDGRTFLGLTASDVDKIAAGEAERTARPAGTMEVGTTADIRQQLAQGQALTGQVGQFGQMGITPTDIDYAGAAQAAAFESIPRTLTMLGSAAVGGALIGAKTGAVTGAVGGGGVGAAPGAVIGAAVGLIAGVAGSMISEIKGQRRDTTNAQQRVLDEGKQTMKDWATLAEVDPANKAKYLAEYNKVAAQIDQAYRQMKLDTQRDVAKFERAIPNLAEFEAFYAAGGERDTLDVEMRTALASSAMAEYKMLELLNRRQ